MATPTSLQREARRALLERAKADTGLTALVPAASISPDGTPTWPFILIDEPTTRKIRAACVRGATVTFDVHAFAKPRYQDGLEVETAYDFVSRIGDAIETVFADNNLALENGANCRIRLSDTQIFKDDEPNARHYVSQINCRVLST